MIVNSHGHPPGHPPGYGPAQHGPYQGHPHGGYPPSPGYGPHGAGRPPPKKGLSAGQVVLGIAIAVLVLGFGSCLVCTRYTSTKFKEAAGDFVEEAEKRAEERKKKKANPKRMELKELYALYDVDAGAAEKLLDDYVLVEGEVREIGKDGVRTFLVLASAGASADDKVSLKCTLRLSREAKGVEVGNKVVVLGEVAGRLVHIELNDCSVE